MTPLVPATYLQEHAHALFVVDSAAASQLTAVQTPWVTGRVQWTAQVEHRAVIGLALHLGKPLHKLCEDDFIEHHLHDLLKQRGPIGAIRERAFEGLLKGIRTKPAGDGRSTVIVFSPHPDDDVISMGGTLIKIGRAHV